MKTVVVLLLIFCMSSLYAQKNNSLLNSLIETEYSFSDYTGEHGLRDGFLNYIADDGILFRPTAVNGKKYLLDSKPSKGFLSWYPVIAKISDSGDIGFTTGPWEYKKARDSAAIAFGNFCTVWQLQKDGVWKFVIDIGNSNSKPTEELKKLEYNKSEMSNYKPEKLASDDADQLIILEKEISEQISKKGLEQSLKPYLNSSSRFLRNNMFPIIGTENISNYLSEQKGDCEVSPIAGKISSSNDLGFTYGLLTITDKENKTKKFNYMHIWRKEMSGWKLAVDVIDELP